MLKKIEAWEEKLPFKIQMYGCSQNAPSIEHSLEKIHREMFDDIRSAFEVAKEAIKKKIEDI